MDAEEALRRASTSGSRPAVHPFRSPCHTSRLAFERLREVIGLPLHNRRIATRGRVAGTLGNRPAIGRRFATSRRSAKGPASLSKLASVAGAPRRCRLQLPSLRPAKIRRAGF